jgi:hypothetical protein
MSHSTMSNNKNAPHNSLLTTSCSDHTMTLKKRMREGGKEKSEGFSHGENVTSQQLPIVAKHSTTRKVKKK